jgi:hypothetical protein
VPIVELTQQITLRGFFNRFNGAFKEEDAAPTIQEAQSALA